MACSTLSDVGRDETATDFVEGKENYTLKNNMNEI